MEINGRIIRAAYMICPRNRQSKKDLPISSSILVKSTGLSADLTEEAILYTLAQFGDIRSINQTKYGT